MNLMGQAKRVSPHRATRNLGQHSQRTPCAPDFAALDPGCACCSLVGCQTRTIPDQRMRKIKAIRTNQEIRPDLKPGEGFPPNDENVEGVICTGDEYIVYETGDELPDSIKPKLRLLSEGLADDICLWRYMDFTKFYSLLSKRALYFPPGELLRSVEPYELRTPISLLQRMRKSADAVQNPPNARVDEFEWESSDERHHLEDIGILCWHVNNEENNALWKIYVGSGQGVAIRTTLGAIRKSLQYRRRTISGGLVEYIDYEYDTYIRIGSSSGYERIFHKAKFYEYEREFRMMYYFPDTLGKFKLHPETEALMDPIDLKMWKADAVVRREGFLQSVPFVPADLELLIHEVVVSPGSGSWFLQLVQSLVMEKISSAVTVRASKVDRWPDI